MEFGRFTSAFGAAARVVLLWNRPMSGLRRSAPPTKGTAWAEIEPFSVNRRRASFRPMTTSIRDISRRFFQEVILPIVEREFPAETWLTAFGLFGYGSEAYGMDDE